MRARRSFRATSLFALSLYATFPEHGHCTWSGVLALAVDATSDRNDPIAPARVMWSDL